MKKFIVTLFAALFVAFNVTANAQKLIRNELATLDNDTSELYEIVNTEFLNVRSGPSTSNRVIGKLEKGDIISVTSFVGSWACFILDGKNAYVSKAYLNKVMEHKVVKDVVDESIAPKPNVVEPTQAELAAGYVKIEKQENDKPDAFGAISGLYMVGKEVHQVGLSLGLYRPFQFGFDYRMRVMWKPCYSMMFDFMPNYSINLTSNNESHFAVFLSPAVGPSLGYSEYEGKSYFEYGLMFTPKLVLRLNKISISAGYNMTSNRFKFKKYYLTHQFVVTFGIAMGPK